MIPEGNKCLWQFTNKKTQIFLEAQNTVKDCREVSFHEREIISIA
jgi:hypothetical protein